MNSAEVDTDYERLQAKLEMIALELLFHWLEAIESLIQDKLLPPALVVPATDLPEFVIAQV